MGNVLNITLLSSQSVYTNDCPTVRWFGKSLQFASAKAEAVNSTYIPIDDSFETIMKSHNQFITSVGLEISDEDQNLPYLYWTPKLHKSPYKHRFIAGSSKCTTKDLSCLLTKVLSTIKDGLV